MTDSTRPDHTAMGRLRDLDETTTPEQRAAARRVIERNAHDTAERDEFMHMLGLKDPGWYWVQHADGHRRRITTEPAEPVPQ